MDVDYLKLIFSFLTFFTLIITAILKNRKYALATQSLSCLIESIYDFLINAFTGAIVNLLNFIRTLIFINKSKINKILYLLILIAFETFAIINCAFTWVGFISLLPTIGTLIRTYSLWQSNMTLIRFSSFTTAIFYGSYYIFYHSYFLVIGYFLLLLISIYSLFKNDIKAKKEKI